MVAPTLTDELIELVLVASLRPVTCHLTSTDLSALLPYLTASPRPLAPDVTLTALHHLPWIDLDFASRVGDVRLMDLMVDLERRRNGRALQWTHGALTAAAARGHVHVLDWWLNQRHLQVEWVGLLTPALRGGHIKVLEWWAASGLKMYFTQPIMPAIPLRMGPNMLACVQWVYAHQCDLVWQDNEAQSAQHAKVLVQRLVTHSYCPQVYEWARAQDDLGDLDAHAIVAGAIRWRAHEALDWAIGQGKLMTHGQLREAMPKIIADVLPVQISMRRNPPKPAAAKPSSGYCTKGLPDAVSMTGKSQELRWLVETDSGATMLDLAGFNAMKRLILLVAREGDVNLLRQIEAKGHMTVSNGVLVAAVESGNVEAVEYVLGRMASSTKVDERACEKCMQDVINVVNWHGGKVHESVGALLDTLVAHGISPLPERSREYLVAAIESQLLPEISWWSKQRDCASLLASDPAMFPTLFNAPSALSRACQVGNAEFLEWWMGQTNVDLDELLEPDMVCMAATLGHLNILKILYAGVPHLLHEYAKYPKSDFTMPRFQFQAMYAAADAELQETNTLMDRETRITIIDSVSSSSVNPKSVAATVKVLDWWLHEARLPMYYTKYAMDAASRHGAFPILDWWLANKSHLELKYSPAALNTQCNANRYRPGNDGAFRLDTRVLHWWHKSKLRAGFDRVWLHDYQCDHMDPSANFETASECFFCGNSAANFPLLFECTEAGQMHLDRIFEIGLEPALKPPVGRLLLRMAVRHYRPAWMEQDDMDVSAYTERLRDLFGELWDDGNRVQERQIKYLTNKPEGVTAIMGGMGLLGNGMNVQMMQAMMGGGMELQGME